MRHECSARDIKGLTVLLNAPNSVLTTISPPREAAEELASFVILGSDGWEFRS